jgi:hypothetical protein
VFQKYAKQGKKALILTYLHTSPFGNEGEKPTVYPCLPAERLIGYFTGWLVGWW